MKAGMVFSIEPMMNLGGYQTEVMEDEWTVLTARKNVVPHCEDKPWVEVGPLSSPAAWTAQQEKTG